MLLNEDKALMQQYEVRGYPTVLFVDPKDEKVLEKLGKRDADSVVEQMKRLAKK